VKLCSHSECYVYFLPRVTYQVYCSDECRGLATKEKIAERYQATKRLKRKGKVRKCLGGCDISLSIYNDSGFCPNCNLSEKSVNKMLKQLKGFIEYEQDN
jgi:predicted nucleic acid-binding Zn ribbon protein